MLNFAINTAFVSIGIAMLLCLLRLVRGPDAADRILALDTLYINAIALLILLGVRMGTAVYFEAALLIALTGFIGTVALARYLERDRVME
jgi:multicomponent K+:H+ antiporter subunit F